MHDMTPKRFAKAKQETTSHAYEIIAHLYKALLSVKPFTLMDGTPITIKAYQPPRINDQGEAECGVDIMLPNGHLEFTVRNSGWGKSFADEIIAKRTKRERRR